MLRVGDSGYTDLIAGFLLKLGSTKVDMKSGTGGLSGKKVQRCKVKFGRGEILSVAV